MRHDEPARIFTHYAKKVFSDVEREPALLALQGEVFDLKSANVKPDARSDVRVRGFWTRRENAFFDFKVTYPFASSHLSKPPKTLYRSAATAKKREYEQRICEVEGGSFTAMVMSSTGGMGPEMSMAVKRLSSKLAENPMNITQMWCD